MRERRSLLLITLVDVGWLRSHLVAILAIVLGLASIPVQQYRQSMAPGVFALDAAIMVSGVAANVIYLLR